VQYASVLQARIIFQAIDWLFFISQRKGTPLGSMCDKTHIHNNQEYEDSAHFMHVRQLLTASCGSIARLCIIYYSVGFPSGKELALLEICNQQVRSVIFWDFMQHRMVILTNIFLLDPLRWNR